MPHGTGHYWERIWKADLQTDEYAAIFFRDYYYYYPQMSDCYEPTCEATDEYSVSVIKWKDNFRTEYDYETKRYKIIPLPGRHADGTCEGYRTGTIDRETAKKIYWNIKERKVSFEDCRKFFKELAGRELRT